MESSPKLPAKFGCQRRSSDEDGDGNPLGGSNYPTCEVPGSKIHNSCGFLEPETPSIALGFTTVATVYSDVSGKTWALSPLKGPSQEPLGVGYAVSMSPSELCRAATLASSPALAADLLTGGEGGEPADGRLGLVADAVIWEL